MNSNQELAVQIGRKKYRRTSMTYKLACFTGILLLCLAGSLGAKEARKRKAPEQETSEQTFRVQTELAEIRVVVTGPDGRLVEDLKKEDFELYEDGELQEISFFSVSSVGQSGALPNGKKGGTGSIRKRLNAPPARSTILYVDNVHLDFRHLNWVKNNLRRIIDEQMTEQDMMAIVTSDGSLGIAEQFTRDRQVLRRAVEQIRIGPISWETPFSATLAGRIMRGDTLALEEGKQKFQAATSIQDKSGSLTRAAAEMILSGASRFRENVLITLRRLIAQLAGMPGQRMIALFSPGFTQNGRDGWPRYNEAQSIIGQAVRSGVVLYSIDGNGLTYEDPDPEKQDALVSLARETGGDFYSNENNLNSLLGRAFEANRFYYVLAYYLKPAGNPSHYRSIKVRVRNHPEYNVRTPKGYSSSDLIVKAEENDGLPYNRLIRAVNAPLPASDLRVTAKLDLKSLQDTPPQVLLTVCLDGDRLRYEQQDRRRTFSVEVLYVIYDAEGRQVEGQAGGLEGSLEPEHLDLARSNGYVWRKTLALKPGTYQARVGIREAATERTGTATAWIEVPDLRKNRIALGDLMFFDAPAAPGAERLNPADAQESAFAGGVRFFRHNQSCNYALRVFSGTNPPPARNLSFQTELLRDGKPAKQDGWQPLAGEKELVMGPVYVRGRLDLAGLNPGIYELSVKVREGRSKTAARRTALIGIE